VGGEAGAGAGPGVVVKVGADCAAASEPNDTKDPKHEATTTLRASRGPSFEDAFIFISLMSSARSVNWIEESQRDAPATRKRSFEGG
jgi:hypothetical protein